MLEPLPKPPDDYDLIIKPWDPDRGDYNPLPTIVPPLVLAVANYLGVANGANVEPPCRRAVMVGHHEHVLERDWTLEVKRDTPSGHHHYVFQVPSQYFDREMVLAVWAEDLRARIDGGPPRSLGQ